MVFDPPNVLGVISRATRRPEQGGVCGGSGRERVSLSEVQDLTWKPDPSFQQGDQHTAAYRGREEMGMELEVDADKY